jgi:DNA-binding NtrC family response regulator
MSAMSILFVDDEPHVLAALRDLLRPQRMRWAMRFAEGPEEALREMERDPADVVVTDLRMPGIRGSTLLALLEAWHPKARRIVLSGHIRADWSSKDAHRAHAVLTKPCDPDALVRAIEETAAPVT